MNIIQQILWRKKLFVLEKDTRPKQRRPVDYQAVQRWVDRQEVQLK